MQKARVREYITSNLRIPVTITYGKRRRLKITLDETGKVLAYAPLSLSLRDIERFVEGNTEWIEKHRQKLSEKMA